MLTAHSYGAASTEEKGIVSLWPYAHIKCSWEVVKNIMSSGIYIIWVREFKRAGRHVYKVGRTKDIARRLKDYPKGSALVFFHICPPESLENAEGEVLSKIGEAFLQRKEFGMEYFEGNLRSMIEVVVACLEDVLAVEDVGALEAASPDADPDVEIVNFVRGRQDILSGSRRCLVTLFDDYKQFLEQNKLINKLSLEKFSVKFLKATGAKTISVRNGLLVEMHVEFAPLDLPDVLEKSDERVAKALEFVDSHVNFKPVRLEQFKGKMYYAWLTEKDLVNVSWAWYSDKHNDKDTTHEFKLADKKTAWKMVVKAAMKERSRTAKEIKPIVGGKQSKMIAYDRTAWKE